MIQEAVEAVDVSQFIDPQACHQQKISLTCMLMVETGQQMVTMSCLVNLTMETS